MSPESAQEKIALGLTLTLGVVTWVSLSTSPDLLKPFNHSDLHHADKRRTLIYLHQTLMYDLSHHKQNVIFVHGPQILEDSRPNLWKISQNDIPNVWPLWLPMWFDFLPLKSQSVFPPTATGEKRGTSPSSYVEKVVERLENGGLHYVYHDFFGNRHQRMLDESEIKLLDEYMKTGKWDVEAGGDEEASGSASSWGKVRQKAMLTFVDFLAFSPHQQSLYGQDVGCWDHEEQRWMKERRRERKGVGVKPVSVEDMVQKLKKEWSWLDGIDPDADDAEWVKKLKEDTDALNHVSVVMKDGGEVTLFDRLAFRAGIMEIEPIEGEGTQDQEHRGQSLRLQCRSGVCRTSQVELLKLALELLQHMIMSGSVIPANVYDQVLQDVGLVEVL